MKRTLINFKITLTKGKAYPEHSGLCENVVVVPSARDPQSCLAGGRFIINLMPNN
jgi:hypothetical protein